MKHHTSMKSDYMIRVINVVAFLGVTVVLSGHILVIFITVKTRY